jgi:hypothetical protein
MRTNERGKGNVTASGFSTAMTLFDGTTWVPEKNLNSDMIRTEYRNRFNKPKPFHKIALRYSMHIVPKKTLVYDKE